ncbi:MAG: HEAT repeat domain-containing protein [Limisphaerales bacterium]
MRKRVHIALAVLLVMLAGVIAWQVLRQREPVYQGKVLSSWLKQYGTNHWSAGRGGELEKQAETAIRQIGTNAIPPYLSIITTRESPLKLKLLALVPKRWLDRFHLRSVYDYRFLGSYGLIALGAEAKPAVPVLIALLNIREDPGVRLTAVLTLRSLDPVACDAVPALIKCLQDPDFTVRSDAIFGLGELHQDPDRVIPILVEFLDKPQNPQQSVALRDRALGSLRQFGPQAKSAIPSLLRLLNDEHEILRWEATNALRVIDPEAAAKAGVE